MAGSQFKDNGRIVASVAQLCPCVSQVPTAHRHGVQAHTGNIPAVMKTSLPLLAVLAALTNAFVWGLSWMPLRWLESRGIPNLWVTCVVFSLCAGAVALTQRGAVRAFLAHKELYWMAVAAGLTNVFFNGALVFGDVVRAVLLFYLMPVWVVLMARWLLREPITGGAIMRIVLALIGAALVLGQGQWMLPIPRSVPDWLAVLGGAAFGFNNVLLRKYAHTPTSARAFGIFIGGAVLPPLAILLLHVLWKPQTVPTAQLSVWLGLALFAIAVLIANLTLQYGAARLSANALSVIMISEVLFAAVSSTLAGQTTLTMWTLAGGALIVAAALLAVFQSNAP
jgi:drug/metabolite transporter (DMT)-like permease